MTLKYLSCCTFVTKHKLTQTNPNTQVIDFLINNFFLSSEY